MGEQQKKGPSELEPNLKSGWNRIETKMEAVFVSEIPC